MPKLLLASSSLYRRALLERLGLPFEWTAPNVDESAIRGESVPKLVVRLAHLKAHALAPAYPDHIIIGSDQAADLEGKPLTKPGDKAHAAAQLRASSGRIVTFHTAVCVYRPQTKEASTCTVSTEVHFRHLTDGQIDTYLDAEQPYDCAGSFKCEGLGIALFESVTSKDPTALIGLPLISLTHMLSDHGLDPLG